MGCEHYFYLLRSCQTPHKSTSISTQTANRFSLTSLWGSNLLLSQSGCSRVSAQLSADIKCPSLATRATCHSVSALLCSRVLGTEQLTPWKQSSSPSMGTAPAWPSEAAETCPVQGHGTRLSPGAADHAPRWIHQTLVLTHNVARTMISKCQE